MPSQVVTSKCPACGAPLPDQAGEMPCAYCGTRLSQPSQAAADRAPEVDGDTHARTGMEAHNRADYKTAVAELERALELGVTRYEPDNLYTILGDDYDYIGMYEQAIAAYQQALARNPRNHEAWTGLGISHRHGGDPDEAERCYREALRIEPDHAPALASLGLLYFYRNDAPRAIDMLEKAIKLDPTLANAHASLALSYALAGQFKKAEAALRQAVLRGYKNHQDLRERIAALKAMG